MFSAGLEMSWNLDVSAKCPGEKYFVSWRIQNIENFFGIPHINTVPDCQSLSNREAKVH